METIILTDNKRLSAGYNVDKTQILFYFRVFAEKIDVNHILNTEVYQSHINKVKFWVIRANIYNQEQLVHQFCKNLVNRGSSIIYFSLTVTKICLNQETNKSKFQKISPELQKLNFESRIQEDFLSSGFNNKQQSKKSLIKLKKTPSLIKNFNNTQFSFRKSQYPQSSKVGNQSNKIDLTKQEKIILRQQFRKDFQISSLSELSGIFLSQEGMFQEFGMDEKTFKNDTKMITTYIFRQNEIQISLSIIGGSCRRDLQNAINFQISEAFNFNFNFRKQAQESTCIKQKFINSQQKSLAKSKGPQQQTYHKILLFLFTQYDHLTDKSKQNLSGFSQTMKNFKDSNKYIRAIEQWKIKDEDINLTQKLSKQYVLIKQEIQNENSNFRNKLKIFEAIIGENVNVDKLLNQEKQTESYTIQISQLSNTLSNNSEFNVKDDRRSQLKSIINPPQNITNYSSSSSNNSEFKRLKQSFQVIRNFDNVITEQTKKIQNLKNISKQIIKEKNQIAYSQARSLNLLKKQIKEIKQEIQLKEKQFQYKFQKINKNQQNPNSKIVPSLEAQQILDQNLQLLQKIAFNDNFRKSQQIFFNQNRFISNNKENFAEQKNHFFIRKQNKTFHNSFYQEQEDENLKNNSLDTQKRGNFQNFSNSPKIFQSIQASQITKQQELLKRRGQQVQKQKLLRSAIQQPIQKKDAKQKQMNLLTSLYEYFQKNEKLIEEINCQCMSFKKLNNKNMNTTIASNFSQNNSPDKMKRNVRNSLDMNSVKMASFASQLNLHKFASPKDLVNKALPQNKASIFSSPQLFLSEFPILKQFLNPKDCTKGFASEEFSIISDQI